VEVHLGHVVRQREQAINTFVFDVQPTDEQRGRAPDWRLPRLRYKLIQFYGIVQSCQHSGIVRHDSPHIAGLARRAQKDAG